MLPSFDLRLPFELRLREPHRDDRGEAFAHVVALERRLLRLQQTAILRVPVDGVGERALEALGVHAALGRRDPVGERVQPFVVAGVPLPRDLDVAVGLRCRERPDVADQRFLARVEVAHEVDDAGLVVERLLVLVTGPLVVEADGEARVQERHHLEAFHDRGRAELDLLEHVGIGPERDGGAGVTALRLRDRPQLPLRHAGIDLGALLLRRVDLPVGVAVAVDLEHEARRERIDHRDADAVQAARDLVPTVAELAARVQRRHHDLGRGATLEPRMLLDRDPPTVVGDAATTVGEQRDVDAGREAGHHLVDAVVDDLPHEMVQTLGTGRADVHPRPAPHGVEALEHLDLLGAVRLSSPEPPRDRARAHMCRP